MILYKDPAAIMQKIATLKSKGHTIAFVPTMGALHQGHISLINNAKATNAITICSIFVNPTQFNNPQDFEKYPITIDTDVALLEANKTDILFLPSITSIYPNGTINLKHYNLGFVETVYDGAFRPGHFQGVCNVVQRLFEIVQPDTAYFGLKDYQQCMVIKKLVALMNWQHKIQLHFCDTLRETDGLAMSSRNKRLTTPQRALASTIYKTLLTIKQNIKKGNLENVLSQANELLRNKGFIPDYVAIADATTLHPVVIWDGEQKIACLIAAFLGDVRLIDNMVIN